MIQKILSENPNYDIWQMLLYYSYPNNIRKYFESKKISYNEDILDIIVSSIIQAEEFFKISKTVSLNILPITLYYGAMNLTMGIMTLIEAKELSILTHGMNIEIKDTQIDEIGSVLIRINNPKNGAITNFNRIINKEINFEGQSFSLKEIISSIPDLKVDFENCYENIKPLCIPVQKMKLGNEIIEKILTSDISRYKENELEIFELIKDFDKNYLHPYKPNKEHYILRQKINQKGNIGIFNLYGKKYFNLGIRKGKNIIYLPELILLLMGLFSLSSLARYYPKVWNPFIKNDSTGERQIIEKFLNISTRYIPNLLLNILESKTLIFIRTLDEEIIIKNNYEDNDIKDFIKKEIKKALYNK